MIYVQLPQGYTVTGINEIAAICCRHFNVPWEDVLKKNKKREAVNTRHAIAYFACLYTPLNLAAVGRYLQRDYTTIINSRNMIRDLVEVSDPIAADIARIDQEIKSRTYSIQKAA